MKKTYLLFILSLFLFSACSGDDDNGNDNEEQDDKDKIEISATMKYRSGSNYLPDNGASLYIFKDFRDYVNYSYVGNGVYQHKTNGAKVSYTQKAIANNDGVATMKVDWGQYSLVVWESAHIAGKYGQNVYEIRKGDKPIKISNINFEP